MTYLARNNACYCWSTFFFRINDPIASHISFKRFCPLSLSLAPFRPRSLCPRVYKRTGDNAEITDDCCWPSEHIRFISWTTSTCWISAFSSIWLFETLFPHAFDLWYSNHGFLAKNSFFSEAESLDSKLGDGCWFDKIFYFLFTNTKMDWYCCVLPVKSKYFMPETNKKNYTVNIIPRNNCMRYCNHKP